MVFREVRSQQSFSEIEQTFNRPIPSAPAFSMLGVNPETVMRPSNIKSFKVDWRIKNYVLAPDLALEAQPLWHIYYKYRPAEDILDSPWFVKKITTLNTSVATAKIDGINHAAYALKLNIYEHKEKNLDAEEINRIKLKYKEETKKLKSDLDTLIQLRLGTTDPEEKYRYEMLIDQINENIKDISGRTKKEIMNILEVASSYIWNKTMLDAAFGQVFTYDNAIADSLTIRQAGWSLWVNGSLRLGQSSLLSGLIRYNRVFQKGNMLLGISYRLGTHKYNFFGEAAMERRSNFFDGTNPLPFTVTEYMAPKHSEDLGNAWLDFNNSISRNIYVLAVGGDFKLNKSILLNFALRMVLNDQVQVNRFLPVANVVCLMN